MDYLVLYTSRTGNTKKIAQAIYDELPGNSKRMGSIGEYDGPADADIIFMGFWVDRETCPLDFIDALSEMKGKRIALFGTCGMGNNKEYSAAIQRNVEAWVPEECEELGYFICQGKIPEAVMQRFNEMKGKVPENILQQMISNYGEALSHPDSKDIEDAQKFADYICTKNR